MENRARDDHNPFSVQEIKKDERSVGEFMLYNKNQCDIDINITLL